MQFHYGDDGLDPACLEGDAQPIEFLRAWTHAAVSTDSVRQACHSRSDPKSHQAIEGRQGRGLLPFEILELVDRELAKEPFSSECTAAYLATIRGFVLDNVARRVGKYRKKHGMFEAEEREDEWDEFTDLTMGASGKYSVLTP